MYNKWKVGAVNVVFQSFAGSDRETAARRTISVKWENCTAISGAAEKDYRIKSAAKAVSDGTKEKSGNRHGRKSKKNIKLLILEENEKTRENKRKKEETIVNKRKIKMYEFASLRI